MKNYLLIAGGPDRKGVVFGLTGLLKKHGFNIEDSSMTMLRGTFSMIMLLTRNRAVDEKKFDRDACVFMNGYQMSLEVREVTAGQMREKRGKEQFLISVSGADRPGIVNGISGKLFEAGVNITDLETKSSEGKKPHAYYMFLEADISAAKMRKLEPVLKKAAKKLGVHVSVNRVESSVL